MTVEIKWLCLKTHKNLLAFCSESVNVFILQDYTFKQNNSLLPNIDQYTNCFEAWFFNAWGIKQRCCYRLLLLGR